MPISMLAGGMRTKSPQELRKTLRPVYWQWLSFYDISIYTDGKWCTLPTLFPLGLSSLARLQKTIIFRYPDLVMTKTPQGNLHFIYVFLLCKTYKSLFFRMCPCIERVSVFLVAQAVQSVVLNARLYFLLFWLLVLSCWWTFF